MNAPRWKKGERLTLTIEDLSDTGEGIGHADGFTFFVKDAVPGDTVTATVMKLKSRYAYAHLDEVTQASPDRIDPPCPVARTCGGCQLQALSYAAELVWKERRVRNALIRIGGIAEDTINRIMLPIAGAEGLSAGAESAEDMPADTGRKEQLPADIYRYRNKAQLPVAPGKDGEPVTGFYATRSHRIIPNDDCLLTDPVVGRIARIILSHMKSHRLPAYDEQTGRGILRHILIRRGYHSGQISVTLVINRRDKQPDPERCFPGVTDLSGRLFDEVPGMTSLSLNLNAERTNVITGPTLIPVQGDACIEDTMCGLRFRISPLAFYQVNTAQAERLYRQAMSFAALTGKEIVVDLYCGIGTITLLAARKAARVIGVEIVPEAVRNAQENAALNGITNVEFRAGKAEEVFPAMKEEGIRPDVLIVDPPRAGLDPACIDAIHILAPARVVYISCNPATLARDLGLLSGDYFLNAVQAYDLFPRSIHVETVVLLNNKFAKAKDFVQIGIDAEDYYKIKDAEKTE